MLEPSLTVGLLPGCKATPTNFFVTGPASAYYALTMRPPIFILSIVLTCLSSPVLAQSEPKSSTLSTKDLSSTVSGTKITYLELIHNLLPDLKVDPANPETAIAHSTIPFKHLADKNEPSGLEGDIKLDSFEPRLVKSNGKQVLLLQLDLSASDANQGTNYEGESVLLAAFLTQPKIKLLDVMDLKTDRFTSFWEKPAILHLNTDNDAFLVYSTHWNSGESYEDLTVLFMHDSKFKVLAGIFLFNTQGCGATFTETPSFRVLAAPARKYPDVSLTVQLKKDADGPECDRRTPGYTRLYHGLYQWNSARNDYRTASRQLDALDKFNQKRL